MSNRVGPRTSIEQASTATNVEIRCARTCMWSHARTWGVLYGVTDDRTKTKTITLREAGGAVYRAKKHFLRMWLRCRALHGRRLLATTREGGNLCASAPRDPGAGCTRAAGCPEPPLRSAHLPLADRLASNGSSRLVRSPGTHLALTEPAPALSTFARAHLSSTMTPHVHQPHGRFSNGNELCV